MPYQVQKGLDLHLSLGWSEFCYGFQVLFTGLHAFLGDMMSQIVNLTVEKIALCQLELQVVLSEALKHNVQAM